ncbi:hypothetical protein [Janthinobacterium lividum]|uniref:hypothetical protein n=1 Tax=Janthinobacterium lividum TaxID=29581 RepID=UPI00159527A9|nr:hypothetical protein [Janthinobacterium lividum]QKY12152.1 hypothetical protein G8765_30250 [Janthinobacterium lividum]
MDEIPTKRPAQDFDAIVRLAEAGIRQAVTAPPTKLVAVKSSMGGFEMRIERIGLLHRLFSQK